MNKNLLKLCVLGCAAVAFNACDTGEYNNLECDESYVAECLSENALMSCENNKLVLKSCAEGSTCIHVDGKATCAADGEGGTVNPITCSNSCIDGTNLKKCNSDGTTTTVDCSLSNQVCENNACVNPSTPSCEVKCKDANTLTKCVEGVPTDEDCTHDAEGNETNKVCGDDGNGSFACVEKSGCVVSCDTDGVTLKDCDADGNPVTRNCAVDEAGNETNKVCGDDGNGSFACVEKSSCVVSCDADGITLNDCDADGNPVTRNCAEDEDHNPTGRICGDNGSGSFTCVEDDRCTESVCDGTDTLKRCGDNERFEVIDCEDLGMVCGIGSVGEPDCIAKCTAADNKCSDDATTAIVCDTDTGLITETVCASTNPKAQCKLDDDDLPVCEEAASIIGLPCSCDSADCTETITGAQFKAFFKDDGKDILPKYFDSSDPAYIPDDANIIVPNLFTASSKGCEALKDVPTPDGMGIVCYRDTAIQFAPSIVKIVSTDFPEILKKYDESAENTGSLAQTLTEIGNILSGGIQFKAANVGYCTFAAMSVNIDTHDTGLFNYMFQPYVFDESKDTDKVGISSKLSRGTVVKELDSDDVCPAGSSYFRYKLAKKLNFIGDTKVEFSMCLQNCAADTDCNDGYNCIDMDGNYCDGVEGDCFTGYKKDGVLWTSDSYASGRAYPQPAEGGHKICFSREAIGSFFDLKGRLNLVRDGLKDAGL